MKRLEGKVAVVTGGNSGIGLATAKRLQEEGTKVAISGRSRKTLDEAVGTIGNGVVAVQADVAKLTDVDKLYDEAVWTARESGGDRGIFGVARCVVHHRRGNQCRRRVGGNLNRSRG
ncbi:MAG: SDR family NAD(P)-dependent oxidoreductase [Terriglobia bacterium]|jgi:NAD(P)-dependent dehydrogenase (short-subunit alcohol dehydrogenase family)